ncbi:methyltransferase type 12 [Rhodobacteraceae bacterium WD3A24]|nr:methyltransferase type 12 [Rhodobacteraceae bacterium WD3A24]
MTTLLHEERLGAVLDAVRACRPRSVADLGCGRGDLLVRLATLPGVARVTGLDTARDALEALRARLAALPPGGAEVTLVAGAIAEAGSALAGHDCATLVEVIEHVAPAELPALERAVFARMRPARVVVTTPNAEFNPLLGVPTSRRRHPGHRFEWPRRRFRDWTGTLARRHGYHAACRDIAGCHPDLGGASQMAVFDRDDA